MQIMPMHTTFVMQKQKKGVPSWVSQRKGSLCWRVTLGLFLFLLSVKSYSAASSSQAGSIPNFASKIPRIVRILSQPAYAHARWGIEVRTATGNHLLFATNATQLFIPASNTKIFTAALAWDRLGPNYRIRTSLYAPNLPTPAGVLQGPLRLYGRGDPSWCAFYLGNNDPQTLLHPIIALLQRLKIHRIEGDLILDATFFHGPPYGAGWAWDDLSQSYAPPVTALLYAENTATVTIRPGNQVGAPVQITCQPSEAGFVFQSEARTIRPAKTDGWIQWQRLPGSPILRIRGQLPLHGSPQTFHVTVADPLQRLGKDLAAVLREAGIQWTGTVRVRTDPLGAGLSTMEGKWIEIGRIESPPLADLLHRMLTESHNLTAQALFLHLGACSPQLGGATTEENAVRALRKLLRRLHVPLDQVQIVEGTGLSRRNLVSPHAVAELLWQMIRRPNGDRWIHLFPRLGWEGTLRHRGRGSAAVGRCWAKSGYLKNHYALSGYLKTRQGQLLIFSIFLNNFIRSPSLSTSPTADIDRIVSILAE